MALGVLLGIVIRIAVFLIGDWIYPPVYEWVFPPTGDADIGEGLLDFALMVVAAAVWGAWDGHHLGLRRSTVVWLVTGVLVGGIEAFTTGLGDPGNSIGLMLSDLADSGPFLAGLIVLPALAAAAFASGVRAATTPSGHP